MRTLFLHPPSFDGFDGGAGARYQMKREVRSFWYPTWLAQPAALVEGSKLIDAPPHGLKFEDIVPELKDRDLVVMHTSTPSFKSDAKTAEMIKAINPGIKIGFIGAKVAVEPEKSLIAGGAVDFVARNEFDFTIKEVADGVPWSDPTTYLRTRDRADALGLAVETVDIWYDIDSPADLSHLRVDPFLRERAPVTARFLAERRETIF